MGTDFKKWVDIENSYNQKFIDFFSGIHPEILIQKYTISEKIDGANFSLIFYADGTYKVASRNGILENNDNFYNYKEALKEQTVANFIEAASKYCKEQNISLQFVGELFGAKVQKRVNYGEIKWRCFAIYRLLGETFHIFNWNEITEFGMLFFHETKFYIHDVWVHIFNSGVTLAEALNFDINRNSHYTPSGYEKPNIIEGVVIRPTVNFVSPVGEYFILKRKNDKFLDRPKPEQRQINVTEDYTSLLKKANGYINENRTADLIGKYGVLDDIRKIGDYIKYYMEDFLKDFEKDFAIDYANISAEEQKMLRKCIAGLIKGELFRLLGNPQN